MSSLRQILTWGKTVLREGQIQDWEQDAWYLLEEISGYDRTAYFLHSEEEFSKEKEECYRRWIKRRLNHEPLQHILEKAWFMGLEFYVNGDVLIPRQDTELLVEEASKVLTPGMKILDMCTGSGCILLSLLAGEKQARGVGVDISPYALEVAKENERRLIETGRLFTGQTKWIHSDVWEQIEGTYDILVSNPPYIPSKEIEGLMPEVREHDPRLALDGAEDGLAFYRRIIAGAGNFIRFGGYLFLEIGCDQGEAVTALLKEYTFTERRIYQDLAGRDRVVAARVR